MCIAATEELQKSFQRVLKLIIGVVIVSINLRAPGRPIHHQLIKIVVSSQRRRSNYSAMAARPATFTIDFGSDFRSGFEITESKSFPVSNYCTGRH